MNEPHPNEVRNAIERQRLHCHGYGNAEERSLSIEDRKVPVDDPGGNIIPDRIEANLSIYTNPLYEDLYQAARDEAIGFDYEEEA